MPKTSIAELNKKYKGSFRAMTQSEIKKYQKDLNKRSQEWYEPYAIRMIDNVDTDVVCQYDDARTSTDELFISIKK